MLATITSVFCGPKFSSCGVFAFSKIFSAVSSALCPAMLTPTAIFFPMLRPRTLTSAPANSGCKNREENNCCCSSLPCSYKKYRNLEFSKLLKSSTWITLSVPVRSSRVSSNTSFSCSESKSTTLFGSARISTAASGFFSISCSSKDARISTSPFTC